MFWPARQKNLDLGDFDLPSPANSQAPHRQKLLFSTSRRLERKEPCPRFVCRPHRISHMTNTNVLSLGSPSIVLYTLLTREGVGGRPKHKIVARVGLSPGALQHLLLGFVNPKPCYVLFWGELEKHVNCSVSRILFFHFCLC